MKARIHFLVFVIFALILKVFSLRAYGQKAPALNSFYIAAHVFSDASPHWFEYILDVQPEATGSRLRHIRIAPASEFCARDVTIRGIEKHIELSPSGFVTEANLCSMNLKAYNKTIEKFTRKGATIDDTVAYTVVASCGTEKNVFKMPYIKQLDVKGLRKTSPDAAHIVDLYSKVRKRAFPSEPINGQNNPKDYELQLTAEAFIPDLRSGRFDAAFEQNAMRKMLELYRGPVRSIDPQEPSLIDANKWDFVKFVNAVYPPLARMARIQAKVEMELLLETRTGHVLDAKVLSGHALLNGSATDAVRQWVFNTNQTLPDKISVTLDYALGCRLRR